jgi:uncharacterized phage protein (TIGR01671 family)
MRELKFRAWDDTNKKLITPGCIINKNGKAYWDDEKTHLSQSSTEVMQFTGCYDINKKEIYEGDICNVRKNPGGRWLICEVMWSNYIFCWIFRGYYNGKGNGDYYSYRFEDMYSDSSKEIIGNIYENPELLD